MENFNLILCIASLIVSTFALTNKLQAVEHLDENRNGYTKKHLDEISRKVSNLEHLDEYADENLDEYADEFLEFADSYKRKGMSPEKARAQAYAKMTQKHGKKFQHSINHSKSGRIIKGNPYQDVSALFNITMTRGSANITKTLPVPLFAFMHYFSNYSTIVNQYMPAGVTIISIAVSNGADVVINYSDGTNRDAVTISCSEVPYITFLYASQLNAMRICNFRYIVSDETQAANQFNAIFKIAGATLFGHGQNNSVPVNATFSPTQYQKDRVDVDFPINVTFEQGVVVGIIAKTDLAVTLGCFVQNYNRTNTHPH